MYEFNPAKPLSKAAKKNAKRRERAKHQQEDNGGDGTALDGTPLDPNEEAVASAAGAASSISKVAQASAPVRLPPTMNGSATIPLPGVSVAPASAHNGGSPIGTPGRGPGATSRLHYVRGDATAVAHGRGYKVIAHVCNDLGRWGKGFVMAVSAKWPDVAKEYRRWHASGQEGGFRLGAVQSVRITPQMCASGRAQAALTNASGGLTVANLIGQHGIKTGSGGPPVRYDAIGEGLLTVGAQALEAGRLAGKPAAGAPTVHMPRIGAGLAGGRWEDIEPLILRMLAASPTLEAYVYDFD